MGVYGEFDDRNRPKPSALAMASVGLFTTLAGVVAGVVPAAIARLVATRALRHDFPFFLYAPYANDPFEGLYPLRTYFVILGLAASVTVVTVLAMLLLFFYPTSQKLSGRLALHATVTSLLAWGAIAPIASRAVLSDLKILSDLGEVPAASIVGGIVLFIALLIGLVERRTVEVLGNVFSVESPGQRLLLWALRIPVPWIALALFARLNGYSGGMIATATVIVVTLIENLSHSPKTRFEHLNQPLMREGAATWPLVGSALAVASLWVFGFEPLGWRARVIVIEKGRPALVERAAFAGDTRKTVEPKIEMQWSREKK